MPGCDLTMWEYATADRAYDIDSIMIGTGKLYFSFHPIGTDTTLTELGMYNRDGMIFRPEYGVREIMADQFRSTLRTFTHTMKQDIQFKLMELTPFNMTLAYLNPNYSIDASTGDIRSLCITGEYAEPYLFLTFITPFTFQAAMWQREIMIPKAALKAVGEITYKAEEEAVLDMTLSMNLDFDASGYESTGILFGVRDRLATV